MLDQLELEELEAAATEDELAAEKAARKMQTVRSFERKRPVRQPFPDDIERARVVLLALTMSLLRVGAAVETQRKRDLDAGGDPTPVQGDRHGAAEVQLPGLRGDHATAGSVMPRRGVSVQHCGSAAGISPPCSI